MNIKNELINNQLKQINHLYMRQDKIYHKFAKRAGLSDSAFWLLYTIYESDTVFTQADFCEICFFSKQTINSCINVLSKKGYISLEPIASKKHSKAIALTSQGYSFCRQNIQPILDAEYNSFKNMTAEERKLFISIMEKQLNLLEAAAGLS